MSSIAPSEVQKLFVWSQGAEISANQNGVSDCKKIAIVQSGVLKSDGPYWFTYISAPLCFTEILENYISHIYKIKEKSFII